MSRQHRHPSHHESPHEQRLREIVDVLVPDDYQKQAYLTFAHEVARAERASYNVHRTTLRVPDYGMRTKRVVQKWFERGLHGHLLWLVGQAVIQERSW
jgi:hypothetical protein